MSRLIKFSFKARYSNQTIFSEGSPYYEAHYTHASIMEILRFFKYHDKSSEQHGKFCDEHSLHQVAAQDWVGLLVRSFVQRKQNIAMNDLENNLKKN